MNIDDYKFDKEMYRLRDSIKLEYEKLQKLTQEIFNHTKPLVAKKTKELHDDFMNYFTKHEFEIMKNDHVRTIATNRIVEFEFNLCKEGDTEAQYKFKKSSGNINKDIFIKGNGFTQQLLRWKIKNIKLILFASENFEIKESTNLKDLTKMNEDVKKIIQGYENVLKELDKLEFIYCSETGEEYKDFEDFFKKI